MRLVVALALFTVSSSALVAGSSNSLLDVSPDGRTLISANTDTGSVSIIDLQARRLLHEIPVGDHPEGVAWAGSSPLFLVTVYGDDKLVFVDASTGTIAQTLSVEDEPYGVVVTRDGTTAYVTHDYPGLISVIDIPQRRVRKTIAAGQGLRGLALSHDEKTLYVTEFFTANLLAVNPETGSVTDRWDAYANDNLSRHVVLHPTRPKAYLSHIRSRTNTFDARGSIFPQLSFCDLLPAQSGEKRRRSLALDTFNGGVGQNVVTNPWEAAVSPDGTRIYTIYAGTDDMNVSKTIDDDYLEVERLGTMVRTGKHPRAVRVSPDGREVYVSNTLDYTVTVFDPDLKKLATITVATPAQTPEWRRGKELFQSALQPMGSARWIACSSCHPDGLTDGRVWQNPEGPRKTPNLFGLAHTHPLHWSADRDEVQDFEYTIRGKLMQGRGLASGSLKKPSNVTDLVGLDEKTSGRSADLDALAIYTNSFPVRLSPHNPKPGQLSPEAQRGKAIFFSKETRCAECHSGPYYTDSRLERPFRLHDVGTGHDPKELMGPQFDTPTLLGVYRLTSYLHDGRAKTLAEVFTVHNPEDRHGKTSHLSAEQIDELVAFLKALPYEIPPDDTPNTVKDRIKLRYMETAVSAPPAAKP